MPYIQFSTFTKYDSIVNDGVTLAKLPSPAEAWSQMVAALALGSCVAMAGFMVHFPSTTNGVTDPYVQYAFNQQYKPVLTRHKALTALLQSRNKLISVNGDRCPTDFFPSPPSLDTNANIADSGMTFQNVATVAVPAGTAGWGVGGFALTKLYNDGKTAFDWLLTNLTKDSLSLTFKTITSMAFAPLESKLYDGTDTAFANNIMPQLGTQSVVANGTTALTPLTSNATSTITAAAAAVTLAASSTLPSIASVSNATITAIVSALGTTALTPLTSSGAATIAALVNATAATTLAPITSTASGSFTPAATIVLAGTSILPSMNSAAAGTIAPAVVVSIAAASATILPAITTSAYAAWSNGLPSPVRVLTLPPFLAMST